jgi:hypothetical protein
VDPASALAEVARAVIHGLAWSLLVATLAPSGAAVAAFFGGTFGCLFGVRLSRTRLRTPALLLGAALLLVLLAWFRSSLTHGSALASWVGPVSALRVATTLTAVMSSIVVSAAIRGCSKRRPIFAVLELLLVAVAFAQLLIPHRHGAINDDRRLSHLSRRHSGFGPSAL